MLAESYIAVALQIGYLSPMIETAPSIVTSFGNIDTGKNNFFGTYSFVERRPSGVDSIETFLGQPQLFPLFTAEGENALAWPIEIEELRNKLDSYATLPSDWAGENTVNPTPQIISQAKALISNLSSDSLLPHLSISMDGEIGFTWIVEDNRIEAILSPEGEFAWLCKKDGKIISCGQQDFSEVLPDDLADFITIHEVAPALAA
jgi:hypothetical protein